MSMRFWRATSALVFLMTLGLAPGCGRAPLVPRRDVLPPAQDGGVDQAISHPDGALPVDRPGVDLAVDVPADRPPDTIVPPPDAPPDRPDAGPVDMNTKPDLGPPDLGPPDLGQPDVGKDQAPDRMMDSGVDTGPDADAGCTSTFDIHHCGTCAHDCTKLPNALEAGLSCFSGTCYVDQCVEGFAQCPVWQPEHGCETDLRSDPKNCGGCGITCGQIPGSPGICKGGACVGECPTGYADCTDALGCETSLSTPDNCGACGRAACALANTVASCAVFGSVSSCDEAMCAAGFGNCDTGSPDCEATYGSAAGTCFPRYKGTIALLTGQSDMALAAGSDGARFIGGRFYNSVDFDFTAGVDQRNAASVGSPFITKAGADGGYAWTRTFVSTGDANIVGLAGTPDGGVVAAGYFQGIIDLDPGMGADYHTSLGAVTFIVKLAGDGSFVWGRALAGLSNDANSTIITLAGAADGSVFAGGTFAGHMDLDPGPGVIDRTGGYGTTFVLKLGADGATGWADAWDISFTPGCSLNLSQLAASPAGGVWVAGSYTGGCDFDPGSGIDLKQQSSSIYYPDGFVLALDAAGSELGSWTLVSRSQDGGSLVANIDVDDQGAAYVAGPFIGTVDFDPGAGEAQRTAFGPAYFVAQLSAGGALQQLKLQTGFSSAVFALGRSGRMLAAGALAPGYQQNGIAEVPLDQSLGWTLGFGGYGSASVTRLIPTPSGFLLGGVNYEDRDFDPGPGVDTVPGGSIFVTEYAY